MNAQGDSDPERSATSTTRTAVFAGVGVVVLFLIAFLFAAFVAPVLHTRKIVREYAEHSLTASNQDTLARLGGPNRAVPRLMAYLRLPGWAAPDRSHALTLLLCCGKPAGPGLIELMGDRDPGIRSGAGTWFQKMGLGTREAVPEVMKHLGSPNPGVRTVAANVLGGIGPAAREAVPALEKMLDDEDKEVREAVAWALRQIRGEARAAPSP